MDIQHLFDTIADLDRQTRSRYHLTLGQLIDTLRECPEDATVKFDEETAHGKYPGFADSYRGYYADLALVPVKDKCRAGDLLERLEGALGATFTGYKGGDFLMNKDTPLWCAAHGATGTAVVGTVRTKRELVLVTKRVDF